MFENDYLGRQIERFAQGLGALIFGAAAVREMVTEEENGDVIVNADALLDHMLKKYVREGKINEAENLLFETIEKTRNSGTLQVALDFYAELEKMSDEHLHACHFSRQEILEGLMAVKELYVA